MSLALAASRLGDWSWDAATDMVTLSDRAAEIFGIGPGALMKWAEMRDILHEEDRDRARLAVEEAIANHSDYDIEYRVVNPPGTERWVAVTGRALYDSEGRVKGMLGMVQDISERKSYEKALERSREQLKLTLEAARFGVCDWDLRDNSLVWSKEHFELLGYEPFAFQPLYDHFRARAHPDDIEAVEEEFRAAISEKRLCHSEYRVVLPGGETRWLLAKGRFNYDASGEAVSLNGLLLDITETKRAEEALRKSEETLRFAQRAARVASWEWDVKTGEVKWSEGIWDFLGLEPGSQTPSFELWTSLIHPDDRERVQSVTEAALTEGEDCSQEFRLVKRDGSILWLASKGRIIRDQMKRAERLIGVNIDITEHKQLLDREQALRLEAEESRRRAIFLSDASSLLTDSTDYEAALKRIARLSVPILGDLCFFDVLSEEGEIERVAWHHGDERMRDTFDQVTRYVPTMQSINHPVPESLITDRAVVAHEITDEWRQKAALSGEHLQYLRELNFHALVTAPMVVRGHHFGSMTFCLSTPGRKYSPPDVSLAEELARRAALAIDNARLYTSAERRRDEAEQANRVKDEFLATLSHELRTPLNAILGWASMLRGGKLDSEMAARAFEAVERNARSQAKIIEDLLDISRIITGKLRLNIQPVELRSVVEAALDVVRPAADAKQVRLQVISGSHAGPVSGDPERLQQIVWNLLSNAIKFTPPCGRVQVRVERRASQVKLIVSDTGQGIHRDFLPYVFDRFRQADTGFARTCGGLGLGLAIVRNLVEMHGGIISAYSEGEGKGAEFTITLPLMTLHSSSAPYRERFALEHDPLTFGLKFNGPARLDGLSLLVVEDEPDARDLLCTVLMQSGAEVRAAGSASEAVGLLRTWEPDLIISDIEMPGEDGYSLIEKVRSLSEGQASRTPAIALTAHARLEDRLRALQSGFNAHVAKPVESAELITVIISLARICGKK